VRLTSTFNVLIDRGVAQLAERWSPKPEVGGSMPSAPATSEMFSLFL
jgi:hypothetical protein